MLDKLPEIQAYLDANKQATKREVMRKFAVRQTHLKAWEDAEQLKFIKPKPCSAFNHKGRL